MSFIYLVLGPSRDSGSMDQWETPICGAFLDEAAAEAARISLGNAHIEEKIAARREERERNDAYWAARPKELEKSRREWNDGAARARAGENNCHTKETWDEYTVNSRRYEDRRDRENEFSIVKVPLGRPLSADEFFWL
jgi:hypothetical protein